MLANKRTFAYEGSIQILLTSLRPFGGDEGRKAINFLHAKMHYC